MRAGKLLESFAGEVNSFCLHIFIIEIIYLRHVLMFIYKYRQILCLLVGK